MMVLKTRPAVSRRTALQLDHQSSRRFIATTALVPPSAKASLTTGRVGRARAGCVARSNQHRKPVLATPHMAASSLRIRAAVTIACRPVADIATAGRLDVTNSSVTRKTDSNPRARALHFRLCHSPSRQMAWLGALRCYVNILGKDAQPRPQGQRHQFGRDT
jgi:hypothetical protein